MERQLFHKSFNIYSSENGNISFIRLKSPSFVSFFRAHSVDTSSESLAVFAQLSSVILRDDYLVFFSGVKIYLIRRSNLDKTKPFNGYLVNIVCADEL